MSSVEYHGVGEVIYCTDNGLAMSPANEPMNFDELSELYRVELKSGGLTTARKDLFRAMANLLTSLRLEYDKQMANDPESVMAEGAEQRKKKAEVLVKEIVHIRTQKVANMAIRGGMGGKIVVDALTDEEKGYYDEVLDLTKRHMSEVDRLRGRKVTVATRIDDVSALAHPEPEPAAMREEPTPEEPAVQIDVADGFDDFPEESFDDIPDDFPTEADIMGATPGESAPVCASAEEICHSPEPGTGDTVTADGSGLEPVILRVLEDLPEFVGPDRDYKLFKEDVVTLPKVLADILVDSGKASAVRPTP